MGIFWKDKPAPIKNSPWEAPRLLPSIPETGWRPPTEFPNLSVAKTLSFDTETKDPFLLSRGPGWARGFGHVIGFSVAADGEQGWYFPVRHEIEPEFNLDPESCFRWLNDQLKDGRPKVGANLMYDTGWLGEEGVDVGGLLYDVQSAEALLEEAGLVNLEHLGQKYCGDGKETSLVYEWCAAAYGGPADGTQRKNLWRCSPRLVGPYAEKDATLPVRVLQKQWPLLMDQCLMQVFDMETRLLPCLIAMRRAGVNIDIEGTERLVHELTVERDQKLWELAKQAGFTVNPNSSTDLARAFDKFGLSYNRTAAGAPSFRGDFLKNMKHPFCDLVREYRERDKLISTFLQGALLDAHVNGKVYCQFHPLRAEKGTRSGRFSSSTPNLQNIPVRSELGKRIRQLFIPDAGDKQWRCFDYSQIEYRMLAHFACGEGSDKLRAEYTANPKIDFHDKVGELIKSVTGQELARRNVKTINFGLGYGMGKAKLCESLGLSRAEGETLFAAYHEGAPFVHATAEAAQEEASSMGYITTIMGRRSRFDLWTPTWARGKNTDVFPLPYDQALKAYGPGIERSGIHKALNRRLQGSSADMTKMAMLICWEEGLFKGGGLPRITVHDEFDFSDPGGMDDVFERIRQVMETAIPCRIPIVVDGEVGPTWGDAH